MKMFNSIPQGDYYKLMLKNTKIEHNQTLNKKNTHTKEIQIQYIRKMYNNMFEVVAPF